MKKELPFILVCTFLCVGISLTGFVGKGIQQQQKKYKVELTYQQWVAYSNGLQFTANQLRNSDLPSKQVALVTDSVIVPLLTEISMQVERQRTEEKKVDTSKQKKN